MQRQLLPKKIEVPLLGAGLVGVFMCGAVVLGIDLPRNRSGTPHTCTGPGAAEAVAFQGAGKSTVEVKGVDGNVIFSKTLVNGDPHRRREATVKLADAFCSGDSELPLIKTETMAVNGYFCEGFNGRTVKLEEGILRTTVSVEIDGDGISRTSLNNLNHSSQIAREYCAGTANTFTGLRY